MDSLNQFRFDYDTRQIGRSLVVYADCFEWLARLPANTLHAVVTDPPYGVKEYDADQLQKRANGSGGVWRIPPSFDGHTRAPLPRFTALDQDERRRLRDFFARWAKLVNHTLLPGGHVFIATNAFIAQLLYEALVASGLEFRGQIIRLVRTLRGGDRPKNAESEFPGVSSMPRGCYEPWGIFRKAIPTKMTVGDCLRRYGTGGFRRTVHDKPFSDVIASERTSKKERSIANHPSLKPQTFLRQLLHSALPLGKGIVLDTFMGSGSTVAAAESLGLASIGVERRRDYFEMSLKAIPRLAGLSTKADDVPSLF